MAELKNKEALVEARELSKIQQDVKTELAVAKACIEKAEEILVRVKQTWQLSIAKARAALGQINTCSHSRFSYFPRLIHTAHHCGRSCRGRRMTWWTMRSVQSASCNRLKVEEHPHQRALAKQRQQPSLSHVPLPLKRVSRGGPSCLRSLQPRPWSCTMPLRSGGVTWRSWWTLPKGSSVRFWGVDTACRRLVMWPMHA